MKKRIFSALLAALMLAGLLPVIGVQAAPTLVNTVVDRHEVFVGETITWTVSAFTLPLGNYQTRIDVWCNGNKEYSGTFTSYKGPGTHKYVAIQAGYYGAEGFALDLDDNGIDSAVSGLTLAKLKPGPTITSVDAVNHTGMKVTWSAVPGATGYEVSTCNTPNGTYKPRRYTTGTSAVIGYLTPGARTFFKVSAYHVVNGKKYDLTLPSSYKIGVPVGRATITQIENHLPGRVRLTWQAAPGATGYEVWRSTSPTSGFVRVRNANATTYVNTNLVRGRSYFFKVRPYARIYGVNYYGQWSLTRGIRLTK